MDGAPVPQPSFADRATEPSGVGAALVEGHLLLVTADDGAGAVLLRMQRRRRLVRGHPVEPGGRTMLHIAYLRAGRLPLVIVSDGITTSHDRWEFRTSGLWAEAICEQPGLHWSYGLEAFAVAIDQPEELLGRGYGHRTPLGWELDFESREPVIELTADGGPQSADRTDRQQAGRCWQQAGSVSGLLQLLPEVEPGRSVGSDGIDRDGLPDWLATGLLGEKPSPDDDSASIDRPFAGSALRRHWWSADPDSTGSLTDLPDLRSIEEPASRIAFPLSPDADRGGAGAEMGNGDGRSVWWFGHDGRRWTSEVTTGPGR